ncbi:MULTISPECIES: hypothetical protein [Clostridium]|uniref:DUF5105 domain-containing protein n=1 Tax=Clostridium cibarium TaxID=2762247 RepID=A0ABR8PRB3_9CLOT|nr:MULTISPECIES: hypothetical protein [Clostridium]MBD7910716.1 hypothetical protein [Clostridium cibarium]
MKKTLSLLLAFSIFLLCGCGKIDKPTSVVNDYFNNIKSATNSELSKEIVPLIADSSNDSLTKETTDILSDALSKLEVETTDESIDSNSATVSVSVKGISLSSSMKYLLDKIESTPELRSLNKADLKNRITEILIEGIKNSEPEDRKGTLNLSKENNKWILNTSDDDFNKVIWGVTESQLNLLKH